MTKVFIKVVYCLLNLNLTFHGWERPLLCNLLFCAIFLLLVFSSQIKVLRVNSIIIGWNSTLWGWVRCGQSLKHQHLFNWFYVIYVLIFSPHLLLIFFVSSPCFMKSFHENNHNISGYCFKVHRKLICQRLEG